MMSALQTNYSQFVTGVIQREAELREQASVFQQTFQKDIHSRIQEIEQKQTPKLFKMISGHSELMRRSHEKLELKKEILQSFAGLNDVRLDTLSQVAYFFTQFESYMKLNDKKDPVNIFEKIERKKAGGKLGELLHAYHGNVKVLKKDLGTAQAAMEREIASNLELLYSGLAILEERKKANEELAESSSQVRGDAVPEYHAKKLEQKRQELGIAENKKDLIDEFLKLKTEVDNKNIDIYITQVKNQIALFRQQRIALWVSKFALNPAFLDLKMNARLSHVFMHEVLTHAYEALPFEQKAYLWGLYIKAECSGWRQIVDTTHKRSQIVEKQDTSVAGKTKSYYLDATGSTEDGALFSIQDLLDVIMKHIVQLEEMKGTIGCPEITQDIQGLVSNHLEKELTKYHQQKVDSLSEMFRLFGESIPSLSWENVLPQFIKAVINDPLNCSEAYLRDPNTLNQQAPPSLLFYVSLLSDYQKGLEKINPFDQIAMYALAKLSELDQYQLKRTEEANQLVSEFYNLQP